MKQALKTVVVRGWSRGDVFKTGVRIRGMARVLVGAPLNAYL